MLLSVSACVSHAGHYQSQPHFTWWPPGWEHHHHTEQHHADWRVQSVCKFQCLFFNCDTCFVCINDTFVKKSEINSVIANVSMFCLQTKKLLLSKSPVWSRVSDYSGRWTHVTVINGRYVLYSIVMFYLTVGLTSILLILSFCFCRMSSDKAAKDKEID